MDDRRVHCRGLSELAARNRNADSCRHFGSDPTELLEDPFGPIHVVRDSREAREYRPQRPPRCSGSQAARCAGIGRPDEQCVEGQRREGRAGLAGPWRGEHDPPRRDHREPDGKRGQDPYGCHEPEVTHRRHAKGGKRGEARGRHKARCQHDRADPHQGSHHGGTVIVQFFEAFVVALQNLDGMARSNGKNQDRRDCGPRRDPDAENVMRPVLQITDRIAVTSGSTTACPVRKAS